MASDHAMLRSISSTTMKQLVLIVVYLLLGVVCQTLLFYPNSGSWAAALLHKPWLWVIYFLAAHPIAERINRPSNNRWRGP
jgi:hypothetical protein